jgi:uncharacterized glyoxalase superfamily protein PhnB
MSAPERRHTVTPRIITRDVAGLASFMRRVFGATGEVPGERPAELRIGDSIVMVSDAPERDPMAALLYVYVDDVDATYGRACKAGAEVIEEPADQAYGDRRAMVRDAWGNVWQMATPL